MDMDHLSRTHRYYPCLIRSHCLPWGMVSSGAAHFTRSKVPMSIAFRTVGCGRQRSCLGR